MRWHNWGLPLEQLFADFQQQQQQHLLKLYIGSSFNPVAALKQNFDFAARLRKSIHQVKRQEDAQSQHSAASSSTADHDSSLSVASSIGALISDESSLEDLESEAPIFLLQARLRALLCLNTSKPLAACSMLPMKCMSLRTLPTTIATFPELAPVSFAEVPQVSFETFGAIPFSWETMADHHDVYWSTLTSLEPPRSHGIRLAQIEKTQATSSPALMTDLALLEDTVFSLARDQPLPIGTNMASISDLGQCRTFSKERYLFTCSESCQPLSSTSASNPATLLDETCTKATRQLALRQFETGDVANLNFWMNLPTIKLICNPGQDQSLSAALLFSCPARVVQGTPFRPQPLRQTGELMFLPPSPIKTVVVPQCLPKLNRRAYYVPTPVATAFVSCAASPVDLLSRSMDAALTASLDDVCQTINLHHLRAFRPREKRPKSASDVNGRQCSKLQRVSTKAAAKASQKIQTIATTRQPVSLPSVAAKSQTAMVQQYMHLKKVSQHSQKFGKSYNQARAQRIALTKTVQSPLSDAIAQPMGPPIPKRAKTWQQQLQDNQRHETEPTRPVTRPPSTMRKGGKLETSTIGVADFREKFSLSSSRTLQTLKATQPHSMVQRTIASYCLTLHEVVQKYMVLLFSAGLLVDRDEARLFGMYATTHRALRNPACCTNAAVRFHSCTGPSGRAELQALASSRDRMSGDIQEAVHFLLVAAELSSANSGTMDSTCTNAMCLAICILPLQANTRLLAASARKALLQRIRYSYRDRDILFEEHFRALAAAKYPSRKTSVRRVAIYIE